MMSDTVRYALAFGWLGQIAHAAVVKGQLREVFDYRSQVLRDLLVEADMNPTGGQSS